MRWALPVAGQSLFSIKGTFVFFLGRFLRQQYGCYSSSHHT